MMEFLRIKVHRITGLTSLAINAVQLWGH
jgi:hypothetical protein